MKKIMTLFFAMLMVASLTACGGSEQPAGTTAAAQQTQPTDASEYDPNAALEFETKTNENETVVTIGTIDKSLFEAPVLVTSFGQSTDAAMLDTVMKRVGVEYKFDAVAKGADVAGYKTVIIAVGASSKGLGAAGISEADESARAEEFMAAVKDSGAKVICCHIGGSSRRGALSDEFADLVMEQASYIVLKEDANFDYKFTKYAEANSLPITLIFNTKDTVSVFTDLFTK